MMIGRYVTAKNKMQSDSISTIAPLLIGDIFFTGLSYMLKLLLIWEFLSVPEINNLLLFLYKVLL